MYTEVDATEQVNVNRQLGFQARSVIVDNYTASYLQVQGSARYIPPFTFGFIGRFPSGTQQANAKWITPTGVIPPTAGNGQAQMIFTDEELTPNNGQAVVTPSQQVVCTATTPVAPIGGSTTIANNLVTFDSGVGAISPVNSATVTAPPGTNSLIISGVFTYITNSAPAPTAFLTVTGVQTGTNYLTTSAATTTEPVFACIVSPAIDQQYVVAVNANTGILGGNEVKGTFEVAASFATQAVAVEPGGTPLPVSLGQTQSFVLPGISPPNGAAGLLFLFGDATIAAAGTLTVLAGIAGQRIYLYSYEVHWAPSVFPPAGNNNYSCFLQYQGTSFSGTNLLTQTNAGDVPQGRFGNPACYGIGFGGAAGGTGLVLSAPGGGIVVGYTMVAAQY